MILPQTSMKHNVKKLYGQDAQLLLSFEFILLEMAEAFHKKASYMSGNSPGSISLLSVWYQQ